MDCKLCQKKSFIKDLCKVCYEKVRRREKGIVKTPINQYRSKRGNGCIRPDGYVSIQKKSLIGHPQADKNGRILMHQLIMCEHLKRNLIKGETVHHKNGNRSDNRIENLELWSNSQPSGQRVEDKIKWAKEILKFYIKL